MRAYKGGFTEEWNRLGQIIDTMGWPGQEIGLGLVSIWAQMVCRSFRHQIRNLTNFLFIVRPVGRARNMHLYSSSNLHRFRRRFDRRFYRLDTQNPRATQHDRILRGRVYHSIRRSSTNVYPFRHRRRVAKGQQCSCNDHLREEIPQEGRLYIRCGRQISRRETQADRVLHLI